MVGLCEYSFPARVGLPTKNNTRDLAQFKGKLKKTNTFLLEKSYGDMIDSIGIIPVLATNYTILRLGIKERRLYQKKQKNADYRLVIDYDKFAQANNREAERLMIQNVIHAIRDIKRKLKKGFDGERLEHDMLALFNLKKEDIHDELPRAP